MHAPRKSSIDHVMVSCVNVLLYFHASFKPINSVPRFLYFLMDPYGLMDLYGLTSRHSVDGNNDFHQAFLYSSRQALASQKNEERIPVTRKCRTPYKASHPICKSSHPNRRH